MSLDDVQRLLTREKKGVGQATRIAGDGKFGAGRVEHEGVGEVAQGTSGSGGRLRQTPWSELPDHGGAGESGAHCYIFSAMIFDTAEHEGMDG